MKRVFLLMALMASTISVATMASAATVIATATITAPADNHNLEIPNPPTATGMETVNFGSSNNFIILDGTPNGSVSVSGGTYWMRVDGFDYVGRVLLNPIVYLPLDAQGNYDSGALNTGGSRSYPKQTSHTVTAHAEWQTSVGSGSSNDPQRAFKIGPFKEPGGLGGGD